MLIRTYLKLLIICLNIFGEIRGQKEKDLPIDYMHFQIPRSLAEKLAATNDIKDRKEKTPLDNQMLSQEIKKDTTDDNIDINN